MCSFCSSQTINWLFPNNFRCTKRVKKKVNNLHQVFVKNHISSELTNQEIKVNKHSRVTPCKIIYIFIYIIGRQCLCGNYLLSSGNINGYGLLGSGVSVLIGVGGLGSCSVHPTSQQVTTAPLPFSSTSPRSSSLNVRNVSNMCLVAQLT